MSAEVFSFINMKGGVGKTTLAVNVAYTIAKKENKKVLVIDMDPQMNATQYMLKLAQVEELIGSKEKTIYGLLNVEYKIEQRIMKKSEGGEKEKKEEYIFITEDNLHIIPSHLSIMGLNLNENPFRLRQYIKGIRNEYDIIIIDCPPTISSYTRISLLASDYYVVPMKTDYLSLFGLPLLENYIHESIVCQLEHQIKCAGIILTMVNKNYEIYSKVKRSLENKVEWKRLLYKHELDNRTIIPKALNEVSAKKYIIELGNQDLANQITGITKELMIRGRV